jgi:hypothetical protein
LWHACSVTQSQNKQPEDRATIWMKAFPPGKSNVLLPLKDARAAALGVTMYTACRPTVIALQRVVANWVRIVGPRAIPGRVDKFLLDLSGTDWPSLMEQWERLLGPISNFAIYHRRQTYRNGLTITAVDHAARPLAIIKLRSQPAALQREQLALQALARENPETFRAPRALGIGSFEKWWWSAQEAVFTKPHAPVFDAPATLYDEIFSAISRILEPTSRGSPAHGDLSPWNLRRHRGIVWLYDWEDIALLPPGADRAYFTICAHVLGRRPIPSGLSRAAISYWRQVLLERERRHAPGVMLPSRMLKALDDADRYAT